MVARALKIGIKCNNCNRSTSNLFTNEEFNEVVTPF